MPVVLLHQAYLARRRRRRASGRGPLVARLAAQPRAWRPGASALAIALVVAAPWHVLMFAGPWPGVPRRALLAPLDPMGVQPPGPAWPA